MCAFFVGHFVAANLHDGCGTRTTGEPRVDHARQEGSCMTPLARLIAAVDGYLATKGTDDEEAWIKAFNELLAALQAARHAP